MYLLALIAAALPWLAGGVVALCINSHTTFAKTKHNRPSQPPMPDVFLLGFGGLLGYLVLAYTLWALDKLGLPALTPLLMAIFAGVTLIFGWLSRQAIAQLLKAPRQWSRTELTLLALLLTLMAFALYLQHQTPLFAWDGLNYWVSKASAFISHSTNLAESRGYNHAHKHPGTLVMVAAWSGWVGHVTGQQVWPTPWLLCMVSICTMAAAYVYRSSGDRLAALIAAVLLATMPLAAQHYLAAGYAELWLAAVLLAGTLLAAMGLADKNHTALAVGLLVCGLLATLKNTGAAYALIPWLATALIVFGKQLRTLLPLLFGLACLTAALLVWGFDITLAGVRTAWQPEANRLMFAGYNSVITLNPLTRVAVNAWYSLIVNQSFSLVAPLLLLSLASFVGPKQRAALNTGNTGIAVIVLTALGVLLMLVASQWLLPHGFRFAVNGNDTGNSRFSLPFALLVVPAAMVVLARLLALQPALKKH